MPARRKVPAKKRGQRRQATEAKPKPHNREIVLAGKGKRKRPTKRRVDRYKGKCASTETGAPGETRDALDFFGHHIRRAIRAAQHCAGLFVADHFFLDRVKFQRAAEAIRRIGQMDERHGLVSFHDRCMDSRSVAAFHAIDEILEMIAVAVTAWTGFEFIGEPSLVAIVAVYSDIAVGAVEDVTDGTRLPVHWPQGRHL